MDAITRNRGYTARKWHLALLLALSVTVSACDKPAPEERLVDAGRELADSTNRLEELSSEINNHETRLSELREERRKLRSRLTTLEERLEQRATDLAIFRAVQSALLADPSLETTLVAANVEDRVVTLTGLVNASTEQATATRIARETPGVESVVSRIVVDLDNGD